jgi:predicted phosphodiesterase
MKLAVVSDIHGNLPALQAVAADIGREGVDQVVNLGDILSGPLLPAETADWLMAQGWTTIWGNHERQLLEVLDGPPSGVDPQTSDGYAATQVQPYHVQWLRSLPRTHRLASGVLLVHGTPGSDLVYWLETTTPDFGRHGATGMRPATGDEIRERLAGARVDLVLCGHTHVPRAVHCDGTLIVNPGSVGLQAYEGRHPHVHHMENGSPDARYAIVERVGGRWHARLCSVPYDFGAMAALAQRNGRPDWAYALTTGRMPPAGPTIEVC